MNYYNEIDPYAARWLRNLIAAGHLPAGDVDERSIVDVAPSDLAGYRQCHFFAGIGGWPLAARLAGWPDDRELWTGSPPCQPFSVAGQGKAQADDRHLWPHLFRLAGARRPAVLMGEQVAAAVGKNWLDGVFADMEGIGYACGAAVVPACAVDAPHRRDRLWFVADAGSERWVGRTGVEGDGRFPAQRCEAGNYARDGRISHWASRAWIIGHDGKARRVGTRIRQLADGLPARMAGLRAGRDAEEAEEVEMIPLLERGVLARVGKLRAFGNAIVPQVAAEVIGAYLDCRP